MIGKPSNSIDSMAKALERSGRVAGLVRRIGGLLLKAAQVAESDEGDLDKSLDNIEDALAGAEAMLDARLVRLKGGK